MLKRFAAALLLATTALPGMAADLPSHPFIHVSATADQYIMPDVGEIDIDIVSLEPDADAAWKLVNERLEASRCRWRPAPPCTSPCATWSSGRPSCAPCSS